MGSISALIFELLAFYVVAVFSLFSMVCAAAWISSFFKFQPRVCLLIVRVATFTLAALALIGRICSALPTSLFFITLFHLASLWPLQRYYPAIHLRSIEFCCAFVGTLIAIFLWAYCCVIEIRLENGFCLRRAIAMIGLFLVSPIFFYMCTSLIPSANNVPDMDDDRQHHSVSLGTKIASKLLGRAKTSLDSF